MKTMLYFLDKMEGAQSSTEHKWISARLRACVSYHSLIKFARRLRIGKFPWPQREEDSVIWIEVVLF